MRPCLLGHHIKKGLIVATLLNIGLLSIRDFIAPIAVAIRRRPLNFFLRIGSCFKFFEELSSGKVSFTFSEKLSGTAVSFIRFGNLQPWLAFPSMIARASFFQFVQLSDSLSDRFRLFNIFTGNVAQPRISSCFKFLSKVNFAF